MKFPNLYAILLKELIYFKKNNGRTFTKTAILISLCETRWVEYHETFIIGFSDVLFFGTNDKYFS